MRWSPCGGKEVLIAAGDCLSQKSEVNQADTDAGMDNILMRYGATKGMRVAKVRATPIRRG